MTRKLSGRCQKMDWQKVIFEETGEKFATHCKIWKSALARFEVSQSDSVSILSTISNRSVESEARLNERSILDYFFEEEIEAGFQSDARLGQLELEPESINLKTRRRKLENLRRKFQRPEKMKSN